MTNKNVIVVADSYCARIFTSDSATSKLTEFETLLNPLGRMHERDITSDLPGKNKGASVSGGHTFESKTSPKKHELSEFAKVVGDYVNSARTANDFSNLLLIAEPSFLGELRAQLSKECIKKIVFELNKNLIHKSPESISQYLPKRHIH
jgi:protein required for attachment to host cells